MVAPLAAPPALWSWRAPIYGSITMTMVVMIVMMMTIQGGGHAGGELGACWGHARSTVGHVGSLLGACWSVLGA